MTDAQSQWAEVNLFHCARLKADLSPEACEANRAKPIIGKGRTKEEYDSVPRGRKGQYRPISCEKCTDWDRLCSEVYVKRIQAGIKKDRPVPAAPGAPEWTCACCGEQCGKPAARGLGWGCYATLRDKGGLAAYPRKRRVNKKSSGQRIAAKVDRLRLVPKESAKKILGEKIAEALEEFLAGYVARGGK